MAKVLLENCRVFGSKGRSVYVEDGTIVCVSVDETQNVTGDTLRIDGRGATLLPGLVDTHCHPFELGWLRRNVDLRGTSSITSLGLRLSASSARKSPGLWILGMGWDQEVFSEKRFPTRHDIDPATPNNPALLSRVCGHIALLNTRAIEYLGIEGTTGAEYQRDSSGELTGIIKEGALERAFASIPKTPQETLMADLLRAEYEAARCGLTTLHCVVSPDDFADELEALARLKSESRLSLRYRLYIPPAATGFVKEKGLDRSLNDERVRINGFKLFADGSLGARTAALREDYSDDPGNRGMLRHSDGELRSLVGEADSLGCQAAVHAIGDRAVEQALDALGDISSAGNKRGHRIEHASLAPGDLRSAIGRASIRVTVQPHFIISDVWARERLGEDRIQDLYPLRSFLTEGVAESGGSDAPVETFNPILGMWAAMVRSDYTPRERLTLSEAVSLYTDRAAFNGLDQSISGSVREGLRADLVLLDSNIEGMHPALLRKVGVAATLVDGRVAYSYEGFG